MAQPLEARVEAALAPSSRIADVRAVVAELQGAHAAASDLADSETARSLDSTISAREARAARDAAFDTGHEADRHALAITKLEARIRRILDDESYAQRRAEYQATLDERDELATHIVERYPAIVAELVDMANRIESSDARCERANGARPRNTDELVSAEYVARGCGFYWSGSGNVAVLRIGRIKFPNFDREGLALPLSNHA